MAKKDNKDKTVNNPLPQEVSEVHLRFTDSTHSAPHDDNIKVSFYDTEGENIVDDMAVFVIDPSDTLNTPTDIVLESVDYVLSVMEAREDEDINIMFNHGGAETEDSVLLDQVVMALIQQRKSFLALLNPPAPSAT